MADRWFFIRYADPDCHLRVRFHGDPGRLHAEVLPLLEAAGASPRARAAWRIELDTYEREVERYGGPEAIELAERAFHADSDAVLAILPMLERAKRARTSDGGSASCGVHRLLVDLGLDRRAESSSGPGSEAIRWPATLRWDDGVTRPRRREVPPREARLKRLLHTDPAGPSGPRGLAFEILAERSRVLEPIGRELARLDEGGPPDRFACRRPRGPFAHMHLNRLLRGDNTAQEAVVYTFLARLYEAEARRASP